MYIFLLIAILLIVLFIMKSNVSVETFKNIGKSPFRQVRRVDFNKNIHKNTTEDSDELNLCNKNNTKTHDPNYDFSYHSKYDSTGCVSCKNLPTCSQHNYKCINKLTGYNVQDNCVEDGICRINEDVINMFPVKTCITKNNK